VGNSDKDDLSLPVSPKVHVRIFLAAHGDGPHACWFCEEAVTRGDGGRWRAREGLTIHHLDHDQSNNALENLVPAHLGCHAGYHSGLRAAQKVEEARRKMAAARRRSTREAPELAAGIMRQIRALGRRIGDGDGGLSEFRRLKEAIKLAEGEAVAQLRSHGLSDSEIGKELGVSKQSVQERWPRSS